MNIPQELFLHTSSPSLNSGVLISYDQNLHIFNNFKQLENSLILKENYVAWSPSLDQFFISIPPQLMGMDLVSWIATQMKLLKERIGEEEFCLIERDYLNSQIEFDDSYIYIMQPKNCNLNEVIEKIIFN